MAIPIQSKITHAFPRTIAAFLVAVFVSAAALADTTIRKGERILTGRIILSDETAFFLTCDGRYFELSGKELVLSTGASDCCSNVSTSPFPDPPLPCNDPAPGPRPRPDIQAELVTKRIANVDREWQGIVQSMTPTGNLSFLPWSKWYFQAYGLGSLDYMSDSGYTLDDCEDPPSGGDPCTNCEEAVQTFMSIQLNWQKDFWSPQSSINIRQLKNKIITQSGIDPHSAQSYIENYMWRELGLDAMGLSGFSK